MIINRKRFKKILIKEEIQKDSHKKKRFKKILIKRRDSHR